jgi:hypothetical protein
MCVEEVVAKAHPAGVVGEEPRPARLAAIAEYVARGVALLQHVRFAALSGERC